MEENTLYYTQKLNKESKWHSIVKYMNKWPWFILSISISLICAYIYLSKQQSIYKIQASLLIQDETIVNSQDNLLKEFKVITPRKIVENEIEVLKSYPLMERVVNKLHLDINYYEPETGKIIYESLPVEISVIESVPRLYSQSLNMVIKNELININGKDYPLNKIILTPYGRLKLIKNKNDVIKIVNVVINKKSRVVNNYLKTLNVIAVNKAASVIALSIEDDDPSRGEKVLNTLIAEYNKMATIDKNKVATNAVEFIENRLNKISIELSNIEKNIENYKSNKGITDLSVQAENFLKIAQSNDALLNQVNVQLSALNDLQKYIDSPLDRKGVTPATVGLNDPTLISLINNMLQLQSKRDQLIRTTSEENPVLQTINSQIKTNMYDINSNISSMKSMLISSQKEYLNKNRVIENDIRTIPTKERTLMEISRQQAVKSSLYTYLLQKREETAVALASIGTESRTINPALSGEYPIKPVKGIIYMLFSILGILAPIGIIAGKDLLNNRINGRVDVEEATQIPIIGEIVKKSKPEYIIMTPNNYSIITEQIRTLRTDLKLLQNDLHKSQVILFTSTISGEGKSFLSVNLAMSLSMVEKKTVVIDMDLRMPKLHKIFNIDNTLGVCDYLADEFSLDKIVKQVPGYANYYIITSGATLVNPSELLNSKKLNELINELREHFDYIIIDTPPISIISDARIIAPLADTTFFMVRRNVTLKSHMRTLNNLVQEQRFNNLRIILNAVTSEELYGYNKNYKYGQPVKRNRFL